MVAPATDLKLGGADGKRGPPPSSSLFSASMVVDRTRAICCGAVGGKGAAAMLKAFEDSCNSHATPFRRCRYRQMGSRYWELGIVHDVVMKTYRYVLCIYIILLFLTARRLRTSSGMIQALHCWYSKAT